MYRGEQVVLRNCDYFLAVEGTWHTHKGTRDMILIIPIRKTNIITTTTAHQQWTDLQSLRKTTSKVPKANVYHKILLFHPYSPIPSKIPPIRCEQKISPQLRCFRRRSGWNCWTEFWCPWLWASSTCWPSVRYCPRSCAHLGFQRAVGVYHLRVAGDSKFIWFMEIKLIKCVVICTFLFVNAKIFIRAFACALFYIYIYLIIFINFVLSISCLLLIILFMHASLHVITEGAFLLADWSLV